MNELQSFNFDLHPVRAINLDDAPWWIASDIAAVLGYRNAPDMTRNLDDDEKGTHIVRTLGGGQEVTIISESGLFAAILKSRRPEAKAFRRWVTGTVLPEIRRTGRWAGAQPGSGADAPPSLSTALVAVRTAHRLFGATAARAVWHQLGLPAVSARPGQGDDADLAVRLAPWLAGQASVTHDDCAVALGLDRADPALRLALGRALRLCGWTDCRKERRPGHRHPVYVFRATAGEV